jgi:phage tail protein X
MKNLSYYTTKAGDRLDVIALKFYGVKYAGERTLADILDKNQDLSLYGALLPAGVKIAFPRLPSDPKLKKSVNLWD